MSNDESINAGLAGAEQVEARSTNGDGNNATDDSFGSVGQTFFRVAENSYSDGVELMERARPLEWAPLATVTDPDLGRPVFPNNPDDEINQGRAGANTADGRIPLTDDLRFVNQPTGELPQARDISDAIFRQPKVDPSDPASADVDLPTPAGTNDFHLFFGQALTHDMVETQVNVTAVSIPASTGIGWAGGTVDASGQATAAFLVRVDPMSGQAVRDARGQVIPIFPEGTSYEDQVAALKAGNLVLPAIQTADRAGNPVTIPAVPAASQQVAADALVNHQALLLGSPFALQRTPGVYDEDGVRQQANTETAFLDLGNVYGKETTAFVNAASVSQTAIDGGLVTLTGAVRADGFVQVAIDTTEVLRRSDGEGGLTAFLLTSDDTDGGARDGDNLLPTYGEVNAYHGLFVDVAGTVNAQGAPIDEATASMGAVFDPTLEAFFSLDRFAAGDQRVNQNIATVTQQTIWARNHNEWAEKIAVANPDWSADAVFDLARAINEGEYQKAVHDEYLPTLIGEAGMALMGECQGYNAAVNPGVINEWTTIAFRFGHDQSSNFVTSLKEDGAIAERVALIDSFTRAGEGAGSSVPDAGALDDWMRGQLSAAHQALDGFVVEGNRGQLFGITISPVTGQPVDNDLTVFDIVRGRDHGVNNYNNLREALGLTTYGSFEAFAADNGVSDGRLAALVDLYGGDVSKFDAYVGVLLEKKFGDSQLGVTSTMLVAMQFAATRDGDRFWYENRFADQPGILAMIEASSMADVIARTTGIEHVYRDAFLEHDRIGGTDGADRIDGDDGRDLLIGLSGNDRLDGQGGNDDLHGGAGRDRMDGGAGADRLFGDEGDDDLRGGAGDDMLDGGAGNDDLRGGDGADRLAGGADDDRLRGDAGDDHLDGGAGNDRLWAGTGNDGLHSGDGDDLLHGGDGNDVLDGGSGRDGLFGDAGDDVLVAEHDGGRYVGGAGSDEIRVDGGGRVDLQARRLTSEDGATTSVVAQMENVTATGDRGTTIIGDNGANVLRGGSGDDVFDGARGDDSIHTGDGRDVVRIGQGHDTVFDFDVLNRSGEASYDRLTYDGRAGTIDAQSEQDFFALFFKADDSIEVGFVADAQDANVIRTVEIESTHRNERFSAAVHLEGTEMTMGDLRFYADASGFDRSLIG